MQQLLDYPEDDIEETFCLNFTVRKNTAVSMIVHHLFYLTPVLYGFFKILVDGIPDPLANIY